MGQPPRLFWGWYLSNTFSSNWWEGIERSIWIWKCCNTPASVKMEKSALAELLQSPKWGKASLQKFCKVQNEEKSPCRSSAKSKMGKSVLAEVLQTPKWGKVSLQKSCKRQNGEKRPCRSSAKSKMGKSALAEVLQSPKWGKASLQEFCKG